MASVRLKIQGARETASEELMGLQQVRLYGLWSQRLPIRHIQAPLCSHQMCGLHGGPLMQSWHAVNAFLNLLPAAPSHLSHLPSVTGFLKGDCRDSSHVRRVGGVSSLGRRGGIDRVCFAP